MSTSPCRVSGKQVCVFFEVFCAVCDEINLICSWSGENVFKSNIMDATQDFVTVQRFYLQLQKAECTIVVIR